MKFDDISRRFLLVLRVVVILRGISHGIAVRIVNDSGVLLYYSRSSARLLVQLLLSTAKRLSLKGMPRKINIIFATLHFFHPSFFSCQHLWDRNPTCVPERMIVMSNRANEVKLERFNIVLTSILVATEKSAYPLEL